MKTNFTKLSLIALLGAAGTTAAFAELPNSWPPSTAQGTTQTTASAPRASTPIAPASADVKQVLNLKDGSSVYVFNDGKMAMATRSGQAQRMDPGMVMETTDGQKITMNGDEVARLNNVLYRTYGRSS